MIFVSKNWPNVLKIGWKSPSSLVKFIDIDGNLEELEGFWKFFWMGWSCGFVKLENIIVGWENVGKKCLFIRK